MKSDRGATVATASRNGVDSCKPETNISTPLILGETVKRQNEPFMGDNSGVCEAFETVLFAGEPIRLE